jgi:hypothetical protein
VKVEMTHVTAAHSRVREANLSVQVRTVKIDLATILVDYLARFLDAVLEHTKRRRVCNL